MTDRSSALRPLRSTRADGLPPPPPPAATPEPDPTAVTPFPPTEGTVDAGANSGSSTPDSGTDQPQPTAFSEAPASWQALLSDPGKATREMALRRENQPARPLNVDLTPEVAAGFDDACRQMRLRKKDVVDLLLRGWLTQTGRPGFD